MNNFKILPYNKQAHLEEIKDWDEKYKYNPRYDSIRHYILEDNIYYGLYEVIETNHERYPIGENERKFAFVLLNNETNEIMGFILAIIDNLKTDDPELIIQYIVMKPEYQNKGYSKQILSEIITNSEEYFDTKISSVLSRVEESNLPSRKLFYSLGFNFKNYTNTNYMKAEKKVKILENE